VKPGRILLVNPPSPEGTRVSRSLMGGYGMVVGSALVYPPLSLATVAAVLEREGFEVRIHDAEGLGEGPDDVLRQASSFRPQLCGLETASPTVDHDLALATRLEREAGTRTFLLGSQSSSTPEYAFDRSTVGFVVRGEPEATVAAFVRALDEGDLAAVEGISWRDGSTVRHNPDRGLQRDLDSLPFPARHLLPNEIYRIPGLGRPMSTLVTSRGCPIDCSYCGYTLTQGRRWRYRSAANVIQEIRECVERFDIRNFVVRDPLFSANRKRTMEIATGIREAGLDVRWQCETAIKCLDPELLEAMAEAGCRHVSLGIETGSAELQKRYSNGKVSDVDHAEDVIRACRRVGIRTRGFFMIGYPEETPAMVDQTIALARRLDPDTVQFTAVTPYPGTPLFRQMAEGGQEFRWEEMSGHRPVAFQRAMNEDAVKEAIKRAYRAFYLRPSRIVRELRQPRDLARRTLRYFTLFSS